MSVVIPFNPSPSFIQSITLDNIVLNFKFIWSGRNNSWSMDILDAVNSPILQGIKILNGWELIQKYTDTRLPQGVIIVVSLQGDEKEIDRDGMNDRYQLVYFTEAEVNASV